ncbi:replication initiation factor domain-containing protein [Collimonas fungivorans]|uniref:replication initiation factor domain-containing protein n=1 Tax=Collimonas fungivorans TaxID=158899 RepID=UPI003FA34879
MKRAKSKITAEEYVRRSGGSASVARQVKGQIYGMGKEGVIIGVAAAGVLARSEARTERTAAAVPKAHPPVEPHERLVDGPINNMGQTVVAELHTVDLTMTAGGVKQVMVRAPAAGECAIIDWVNFSVLEDTWFRTARETLIGDEQIVTEASRQLEKIFGFGVTLHREKGLNFFRDSWVLGDDFGFVCFGGQRQKMGITLNGLGCATAAAGWEKRLFDFLTATAIQPQISRIDLAHDDILGKYLSVDWAEEQWHQGGFTSRTGGLPPSIERVGNWHRPTGKGRTLTIGLRTSGKFLRFYEKGRKEGDKNSLWCRAEFEFKSSDRVIPFDVLLHPSNYFVAGYPCISQFANTDTPERIQVKRETAHIVMDACEENLKGSYGKHLRAFRNIYGDKETLDRLCHPDLHAWPKRMKPLGATLETSPVSMHRQVKPYGPSYFNLPSHGLHGV